MRLRVFCGCLVILLMSGGAWALDETILTPTNYSVKAAEDEAFNSAMSVWYSHRYADSEEMR